jgi:hypothetical protein
MIVFGLPTRARIIGLISFISISQILKEDSTYPEALIGRGTANAFLRELEAAIGDFTKVFE